MRVGLCASCANVRIVGNRRGSRFYLCSLSERDPRFPRYPGLPVLECEGFRRSDGTGHRRDAGPPGAEAGPGQTVAGLAKTDDGLGQAGLETTDGGPGQTGLEPTDAARGQTDAGPGRADAEQERGQERGGPEGAGEEPDAERGDSGG